MKTLSSLVALAVLIATASVGQATDIYVQPGGQLPGYYSQYCAPATSYGDGAEGQGRKYDGTLEGKTVEYIRAWSNDYFLLALDIKLSGDPIPKRLGGNGGDDGNLNYDISKDATNGKVNMQEFTFQPGERITWLAVYDSYYKTPALGGIEFGTNQGHAFSNVAYYSQYGDYYKNNVANVGSGLLAGFTGKTGLTISQLGALFYQPLTTGVKTIDFSQDDLDKNSTVDDAIFQTVTKTNATTSDSALTWMYSETQTFSSAWSVTVGLEVWAEASVTAGIPKVAETTAKVGIKVTASGSYSSSFSQTATVSLSDTFTAKPGETVVFTAVAKKGTCKSVPWTGTMTVTFPAGQNLTYPIKGTYNGVSYADAVITATVKPPAKK